MVVFCPYDGLGSCCGRKRAQMGQTGNKTRGSICWHAIWVYRFLPLEIGRSKLAFFLFSRGISTLGSDIYIRRIFQSASGFDFSGSHFSTSTGIASRATFGSGFCVLAEGDRDYG